MTVAETVFWSCLAIAAYVYVAYPLLVWLCSVLVGRRCVGDTVGEDVADGLHKRPMVSLVIIAGDDDAVIIERLQQSLTQDYSSDRLEIVVACSEDGNLTADLVNSFDNERVRLVHRPTECHRDEQLSEALIEATGDIIVLSDASIRLERNAVRKLVCGFDDPSVGMVHARKIPWDVAAGEAVGGLWWQYESFVRRCELRLGSSPDRLETITAFRREVLVPAETDLEETQTFKISRAHVALHETSAWHSVVLLDVVAHEEPAMTRRRDSMGKSQGQVGLFGIPNTGDPNSPLAPGIGPFVFGVHRLLRWLSPITLILAMAYNMYLAHHPFYLRVLLLHELFYLGAMIILWLVHGGLGRRLFDVPTSLVRLGEALKQSERSVEREVERTDVSDGSSERTGRLDETTSTIA